VKTYSLAEVAEAHLPPEWTDSVRWLARRLNRGELRGVRFGRTWRMRDSDIEYMLSRYSNDGQSTVDHRLPVVAEATCVVDGLSPRSRRRLRSAS